MGMMCEIGPVEPPLGLEEYVPRNWTAARLDRWFNSRHLLPTGYRVELVSSANNTDEVILQDAVLPGLEGTKASIPWGAQGSSHLIPWPGMNPAAAVVSFTYSLSAIVNDPTVADKDVVQYRGDLRVEADGQVIDTTARFTPKMKSFFYDYTTLEPSATPRWLRPRKSDLGGDYISRGASYAHTWFLIGFEPERSFNLHVGRLSHGCVSVEQYGKWDSIYRALFRCRTADRKYCGHITVREAP